MMSAFNTFLAGKQAAWSSGSRGAFGRRSDLHDLPTWVPVELTGQVMVHTDQNAMRYATADCTVQVIRMSGKYRGQLTLADDVDLMIL